MVPQHSGPAVAVSPHTNSYRCEMLVFTVAMGKRPWLIVTTGVVKTIMLREVARMPDDAYKKVVVVVDTSSLHGWAYLWHALIGSREPTALAVL